MKKVISFLIIMIFVVGCSNTVKFEKEEQTKKNKLNIINESSKTRPLAVMYDNHSNALPHSNLDKAYLVYELIVEGGFTRIMALFKDKDGELSLGPIRSSRHYFLDYVMENDAFYVHHGGSPYSYNDLKKFNIDNLDAIYSNLFWRDTTRIKPHNSFINLNKINDFIKNKNYRQKLNKDNLFKYDVNGIDLNDYDESLKADEIEFKYSNQMSILYKYDANKKEYKRFRNNLPHSDANTKEQYTFKNIIIYNINNYSIDQNGRQELDNVGNGTGYFITNGYVVPIRWEKQSRLAQTKYYLNNKPLKLNDGNTFIQIIPKNQKINFK